MTIDWLHFTPWPALAGGVLIGLAASLFALANGRVAGISGLLGSLLQPGSEGRLEKTLFLVGLLAAPVAWAWVAAPVEPVFSAGAAGLVVAGVLVGIGTRYGSGCTSGHGVCGLARLSRRSLVATACFMASAVITVWLMRHVWGG